MGKIVFKGGGATVEVSDFGQDLTRRMLEQVVPGLTDKLEASALEVLDEAKDRWPVGRWPVSHGRRPGTPGATAPHSRDTFYTDLVIDLEASFVKARISNRSKHWWFIRPLNLGATAKLGRKGNSAVVEYIRRPMRKKQQEMIASLADDVVRDLNRRR